MKAGQYNWKTDKVEINDVPIPEPGPGQYLVKITSASLCHSDLMHDLRPRSGPPITLGHEGVGIIEAIHPSIESSKFKLGNKVGFLYIIGCCYNCEGCLVHNTHCETGNQKIQGFNTDGFFAEYAVVDWQNVIHIPDSLDFDRTSPLFCAGITAFHAVDSCNLRPGQWLAIIGCGGLGQYAVQYAKAMGYKVIGIDVNSEALEQCKRYGADAVFNAVTEADTYVEKLKDLTLEPTKKNVAAPITGVHAAAVFSASGQAYRAAPAIIRTGGLLMIIGIAKDEIQLSAYEMAVGKYRVKSDSTSTPQRMPKAVEFTGKHEIQLDVEYCKLADLPEMCDRLRAGKASKRMVVKFN